MSYYIDNFKPQTVPLYETFETLPEDGYNAFIETAEIKNSFGTDVINIRFRINEPNSNYNKRIIFQNIKIYDDREKVRLFAERLLNQICTVCNAIEEGQGLDLGKLIGKSMHVYLGIYTNTKNKSVNTLYGVGKEKPPKPLENLDDQSKAYTFVQSDDEKTHVNAVQDNEKISVDAADEGIPF